MTGQSLGGGLAGLVTAIQNASEPLHQVEGYAIAAAPFAAQLNCESSLAALEQYGFTRDDVLGRDGTAWIGYGSGLSAISLQQALLAGGNALKNLILANTSGLSATTIDDIVAREAQISAQWSDHVPNLAGFRIDGEALDNVPDFAQIIDDSLRIDVGSGSMGAKHGPALHNGLH